jgi:hypothetical protein
MPKLVSSRPATTAIGERLGSPKLSVQQQSIEHLYQLHLEQLQRIEHQYTHSVMQRDRQRNGSTINSSRSIVSKRLLDSNAHPNESETEDNNNLPKNSSVLPVHANNLSPPKSAKSISGNSESSVTSSQSTRRSSSKILKPPGMIEINGQWVPKGLSDEKASCRHFYVTPHYQNRIGGITNENVHTVISRQSRRRIDKSKIMPYCNPERLSTLSSPSPHKLAAMQKDAEDAKRPTLSELLARDRESLSLQKIERLSNLNALQPWKQNTKYVKPVETPPARDFHPPKEIQKKLIILSKVPKGKKFEKPPEHVSLLKSNANFVPLSDEQLERLTMTPEHWVNNNCDYKPHEVFSHLKNPFEGLKKKKSKDKKKGQR